MKKIVLTSLLAVFAAASANAADYFVGGAASLKLNDEHTNVMGIAPEVGWKYNDNWDFGIGAGFMYNGDVTPDDLVDIDRYEYGVDLFARYKVAQWGNFKLLLKGTVGADFNCAGGIDCTNGHIRCIRSVYTVCEFELYGHQRGLYI